VLGGGRWDLHPASAADGRVRDIAVAGNFVAGVHDDDSFAELVGKDAGSLTEEGCFPDSWSTQEEDALTAFDEVADDGDGAVHGAADAAGEAHDFASAIANGGNTMEGALNAGAVVVAEHADATGDKGQVVAGDIDVGEIDFLELETSFGWSAKVEHDLNQRTVFALPLQVDDAVGDVQRQDREQVFEVIGDCVFRRLHRFRFGE
jgi:hypothetical protein